MKIGIVSDSHGNYELLKKAGIIMKKEGVELILHLGDDSHEGDFLKETGLEIIKVPGVYEEPYKDENIENRLIKEFNGWKCLLSHTPFSHNNDLKSDIIPEEVIQQKSIDIFFFGHTHVRLLEMKDGILYINPGHLKPSDKKGFPPSYAIAELSSKKASIRIIELETGKIIKSLEKSG